MLGINAAATIARSPEQQRPKKLRQNSSATKGFGLKGKKLKEPRLPRCIQQLSLGIFAGIVPGHSRQGISAQQLWSVVLLCVEKRSKEEAAMTKGREGAKERERTKGREGKGWLNRGIFKHRLLFPAFFAGSLADWLDFIVISSLITFTWQRSASEIATIFIIYALPKIILGGLAGSFAARQPLIKVFCISLGARAITMIAMAFLATDMLSLGLLVLIKSSFSVLYLPAEQLSIKKLAEHDAVEKLSGWLQIIHQGAKLVGPAAGGALLMVMAPSEAFLVSGALFALALAMLAAEAGQLRSSSPSEAEPEASPGHGLWQQLSHDVSEGLRYALARYPLNLALALVTIALMVIFLYDNFIPMLAGNLGFDSQSFGMTISLVGLGGVVGGFAAIKLTERFNPVKIIPTAISLSGPPMIYFGLCEIGFTAVVLPVFFAAWFFVGVLTSIALVPFNTYIVKTTPKAKLGTITGLNESVQTLGVLAGPIMGAAIVENFGVGAVFVLGGLLSLAIGTIGLAVLTVKPPHGPTGAGSTRDGHFHRVSNAPAAAQAMH